MMRLLVLCTHNSARSQIAEGWLRHHAMQTGLPLEVWSAGTESTQVKPGAVQVMQEVGIDISHHTSKALLDLPSPFEFDIVLTVCDDANEHCPAYPARTRRLHISIPDPSGKPKSEWRRVRGALEGVSQYLVAQLSEEKPPTEAGLHEASGL